ncbi:MAG: hypothetical protein ABIR53_00220 [Paraperlucidibaca sp.]
MRNLLFALAAAVSLTALWFFLAPSAHVPSVLALVEAAEPMDHSEPATGINDADYSWQIQAGTVSGPQQIEVPEGEALVLAFLSDEDDEIHLHGYEQALRVSANQPATMSLTLVHSGRFELESHRLHRTLSILEVEPR